MVFSRDRSHVVGKGLIGTIPSNEVFRYTLDDDHPTLQALRTALDTQATIFTLLGQAGTMERETAYGTVHGRVVHRASFLTTCHTHVVVHFLSFGCGDDTNSVLMGNNLVLDGGTFSTYKA